MSAPRRAVIDASVVLKWSFNEPGRFYAAKLLDEFEAGDVVLLAPNTLIHETASALSKRCRRAELTASAAKASYLFLMERMPILFDGEDLTKASVALATEHHISYWDALYLALAIEHRCDLITADARFQRTAVKHYPYVVLLGHATA